ncbi:MAG: ATP-dependent RNA helicase, partial [Treponema sp.]|nr:ATP-dependent RNA helicase [Treponema sp.]
LFSGEKLEIILSLAPALDIGNASRRKCPGNQNFNSGTNLAPLLDRLDDLVKPVIRKKGSKELGFLALCTGGNGDYWFRCQRRFHAALNESLSSIEALIDELGEEVDAEKKRVINLCYRRLSDFYNPDRG